MTVLNQAVLSSSSVYMTDVRKIEPSDLWQSLKEGLDDFRAMPTHLAFVTLLYPLVGLLLAAVTFGYDLVPLLFPLMSGFALVGPIAGIGLYELSRRREQGLDTSWGAALGGLGLFQHLQAASIRSAMMVGLVLIVILGAWLFTAQMLYWSLFGSTVPATVGGFLRELLTTGHGWALIVLGNAIGFAFALVALAISAVSFPLVIDKPVPAGVAIQTSVRVMQANPRTMLLWGLIVAGLLAIGSIPLFIGLAVVIPVLGHATWHLYRKAVAP